MTPEELSKALQDRRISVVSKATGLHQNTLRKIRNGENLNPTYKVIKTLSDYLEKANV
ncbi:helix-turn-helix domain-containing protein [Acidithiobacillus sp.]|uniref:helix-turn-helix domain-containing protein n=1 Tax=Acidithiobacillus sp. TaxID=1872118 RepID=UPI003D01A498